MVKWHSRAAVYKFSLICTYIVFLIFVLAFSIPMWLGFDVENVSKIAGLWMGGNGTSGDIDDVDATGFKEGLLKGNDEKDWLEAVRGLWVAGVAFYLVGVVFSFAENCCMSSTTRDYGVSACLILLAGLCGAAGIITMAIELEDLNEDIDYLWGYILAVVASGLAIILAVVLLISKNYSMSEHVKNSRTADYVYAHGKHQQNQQRPYTPEYNNPGYRGDELPLVNGVPFHQPYGQSPYSMYRTGQENGFSGNKYDQGTGYYPYGYKDPRPGNRTSVAESADLSNGYTQDIVHAEHSLGRRADHNGGRPQYNRGENYYNGTRPY